MKASINGTSIAYEDLGLGPAVVLIHGFPFDRRMWQNQATALADEGFRVILPDLRGFGESQIPAEPWTLATLAEDMAQLLNYLGIGRAVFCGASIGGSVVFHLLEHYPEKVAGVCFVSSRSRSDDMIEKVKQSKLMEKLTAGNRQEADTSLCDHLLGAEAVSKHPELMEQLRSWVESVDTRSLMWGLQAIAQRKDLTAKLEGMVQPGLVLTGSADRIVSPEHGRTLAQILGNGYEFPGVGHMVNLEQSENFNNCLVEFLLRVRQCRHGRPPLSKVA